MNGYELSRNWFDFCFDNPDKVKPNHTALYFFTVEHCNRLGWKPKFGLPTEMAKEAIGIKSYNTYKATLNDLIDFGFIIMIERSKNQYSANIIALSNFDKALDKAPDKALDKALIKHMTKQGESTVQSTGESIDSINKQYNKEQLNQLIDCSDQVKEFLSTIKKDDGIKNFTDTDKFNFFIDLFNHLTKRKFKGDSKTRKQFNARLKEKYTSKDFDKAIKAALADNYHKESNYKYLTPEYITRADQLNKWVNIAPADHGKPQISSKYPEATYQQMMDHFKHEGTVKEKLNRGEKFIIYNGKVKQLFTDSKGLYIREIDMKKECYVKVRL